MVVSTMVGLLSVIINLHLMQIFFTTYLSPISYRSIGRKKQVKEGLCLI